MEMTDIEFNCWHLPENVGTTGMVQPKVASASNNSIFQILVGKAIQIS